MNLYRAMVQRLAGRPVSERSAWQWFVLPFHLAFRASWRLTMCRLHRHRWLKGYGAGGYFRWCEACNVEEGGNETA
ncbi:MAG TPA: hypothetical protein VH208_04630 [Myxococcaceae bacterium]|nr:hypothetical protein [Myxococcaceae bacterium]